MTELTFLIDLLLHDELSLSTKDKIAARIREVEQGLSSRPMPASAQIMQISAPYQTPVVTAAPQAASTLAAMARNGFQEAAPIPVESIAQTPAAAQAIASRQEAINNAIGMNINSKQPGRTSPRKF